MARKCELVLASWTHINQGCDEEVWKDSFLAIQEESTGDHDDRRDLDLPTKRTFSVDLKVYKCLNHGSRHRIVRVPCLA